MRALVLGSNGFIGSAVREEFANNGYDVVDAVSEDGQIVDLLNIKKVRDCVAELKPDVILNCAGVVSPTGNFEHNVSISKNIISAVAQEGLNPKRIIVTGSAGEYGVVDNLPVSESAPLLGASSYAKSKIKEEQTALSLAEEDNLNVTVVRVFNPIGVNMHERFLITSLLKQIKAIQNHTADHVELSRLDAARDYVDVRDIARAYRLICEGSPKEDTYNLGSGRQVTNGLILELLLKSSKIIEKPKVVETVAVPEAKIASQADISRIKDEFGWTPVNTIESVIEDIIHASK